MQIIQSIHEMQSLAISLRSQGKLLGFVPTMGCLHEGHLKLVDVARERADVVIASVFVNPTQFGPNEDFDRYPRQLESDAEMCRQRGVDILFAPKREDIYPQDFSTFVSEEKLSKGLCGVSRPGHFRGVCTIVTVLFNIVRPDVAVFGQKDAQQAAIIRKMVADLWMPVQVVVAPTVREPDGLAMSSRNRYLQPEQRADALRIYQSLMAAKKMVEDGVRSTDRVVAEITNRLAQSRRIRVIYVTIVDKDTMAPVRTIEPGKCTCALAVWVNEVRLIDNMDL